MESSRGDFVLGELTAVTQLAQMFSALGVFGVLAWLLYQMPTHFKQERESREKIIADLGTVLKEERASREKTAKEHSEAMDRVSKDNIAAVTLVVNKAEEQARAERDSCEQRHKEMMEQRREEVDQDERRHREVMEGIGKVHSVAREIKHETANLLQDRATRQAIEELKRKPKQGGGGS